MTKRTQETRKGRGAASHALGRNTGAQLDRFSHRRQEELLEKLKRSKKYVGPALVTLAGAAQASDVLAAQQPPPIFPPYIGIPALDFTSAGLFVGGLAASGGIMIYRNTKTKSQNRDRSRGSSSKKK